MQKNLASEYERGKTCEQIVTELTAALKSVG